MVITVGTSLIAITAFYGTWTGLDFIFKSTDTRPYGLATNGAYCFVSLMYKMHGLIRTCTNSVLIHTFCLYPPFSTKCIMMCIISDSWTCLCYVGLYVTIYFCLVLLPK